MFYHNKLQFAAKQVLKSELLQESADYAQEMLKHIYKGYSDGIIEGVEVAVEDEYIIVNPGIIKHNDILYHMKEKVRIPYEHSGKLTVLKIRFSDANQQEEKIQYDTEFMLTEEEELFPYEMELGRFISEKGATLQGEAENFEALSIKYNHFDIRKVPYAGKGVSTISPRITMLFAKALSAKQTENFYDIAFTMQCLTQKPIEREVIYYYLSKRLGKKQEEPSNEQIYQELLQILKQGAPRRQGMMPMNRKMIVE